MAFSGLNGSIELDGTPIAFVNNWKMNVTSAELDASKFGDTDKRRYTGVKSASGSCSGVFTTAAGNDPKVGILGLVKIQSAATAMTDEPTTADVTKTIFTITDTAKRLISLDPSDAPVVKYDGTPVADPTDYVIDFANGTITFAVTPGNDAVTITGKYITMTTLPGVQKFSIDTSVSTFDVTAMVEDTDPNYGWKRIVGALGEWSVKLDGFLEDSTLLDLVTTVLGGNKHFQFFFDQDDASFAFGFGAPQVADVEDPITGAVTLGVTVLSSSTLYRNDGNALWVAYQARDLVTMTLVPNTGDSLEGEAILTKVTLTQDVNGIAGFDCSFEIDGAVSVSIA
jgi:predicted secreted protein